MIKTGLRRFGQSKTATMPKVFALKHSQPRLNLSSIFFESLQSTEQINSVIRQLCEINDVRSLDVAAERISPEIFIGSLVSNFELVHRSDDLIVCMVKQTIRLLHCPEVSPALKLQALNYILGDSILRNKLFGDSSWVDGLAEFMIDNPKTTEQINNLLSESAIATGLETKNLIRYLDFLWMLGLDTVVGKIDFSYYQGLYPSHQLALMLMDKHSVLELNDYLALLARLRSWDRQTYIGVYLTSVEKDFGQNFMRNLGQLANRKSNLNKYYVDTLFKLCLLFPDLRQEVSKNDALALMSSIHSQSVMRYAQLSFCIGEAIKVPNIALIAQFTRSFSELEAVYDFIDFEFLEMRSLTILDLMEFSLANTVQLIEFVTLRSGKIASKSTRRSIEIAFRKASSSLLRERKSALWISIQKISPLIADLAGGELVVDAADYKAEENERLAEKIKYINAFVSAHCK